MNCSIPQEASRGAQLVHIDVKARALGEGGGVVDAPLKLGGRRIDQQRLGTRVVLANGCQQVSLGKRDPRRIAKRGKGTGHSPTQGRRVFRLALTTLGVRMPPAAGGGDAREEGGAHQPPAGALAHDPELVGNVAQGRAADPGHVEMNGDITTDLEGADVVADDAAC